MVFKLSKIHLLLFGTIVAVLTVCIFFIMRGHSREQIAQARGLIESVVNARTATEQGTAIGEVIRHIEQGNQLLEIQTCTASGIRTTLLPSERWGDAPAFACIIADPVVERDIVIFRILAPGIWNSIQHHHVKPKNGNGNDATIPRS